MGNKLENAIFRENLLQESLVMLVGGFGDRRQVSNAAIGR
jgi:hypothetical protein